MMMRLGANVSTAGGVYKAFERGAEIGCDSVMVYTKSNRQWSAKPFSADDLTRFQSAEQQYRGRVDPLVIHAAYLINIASPDPDLWEKSRLALRDEVERAHQLGIERLVFHPGSHMGEGEEAGLQRIATALTQIIDETADYGVRICLETMAGQGTNLGHRFEHLAYLLEKVDRPTRLGICLDTCHIFAAGYDIRTPEAYHTTIAELDRLIGTQHVHTLHLNDSKHDLGSRKDRHHHIGQGEIGLLGFAQFIQDPRWYGLPAHIETIPEEKDEGGHVINMDRVNLETLRRLAQ